MQKVILITGTRKGIGKALADYYLKKEFIVIGCSRGPSSITHANYTHYELDISDEKLVIDMVRNVSKQSGRIDILLNNAGIASMNHFLLTPVETVQNIFRTNFIGTFLLLREVAKIMIRQKKGRIVNFTTVAVPLKLEGESIYAASKAAVECFTNIASKELGNFGITVNAIGPTPIRTELIRTVPKEKIEALINKQAIKRFANFDDIFNVVDFFIGDKSEFITGQTIYLGGVSGK